MGYVHDTQMSQFIPPSEFQMSAGTWTMAESNSWVTRTRSQADAAFTALIPIPVPSNAIPSKGVLLKSIELIYSIETAAVDDFATVELELNDYSDDAGWTAAPVSITLDTDHDTAAERLAADDHKMIIELDEPMFVESWQALFLKLVVDCAATTDFIFSGAIANYTLRV